jgi:hypothetical protein
VHQNRLIEQVPKSKELMVVVNLPEHYRVTIVDYDVEDSHEEDIEKSPIDGEPCHIRKF